jgi:hypothetical protein
MKAFYTCLFICAAVMRVFPQYLLCTEIPIQYKNDSVSFGKTNTPGLGDSMMTIPVTNSSDTAFYAPSAKLVALTPLPGGVSIITGDDGWQPFAVTFKPGQTVDMHFYFKVDSFIPEEYTTTFQLWLSDPIKRAFDSCVFSNSINVNLNPQLVPEVFTVNTDIERIYPIPTANILHLVFKPEEEANRVLTIRNVDGKMLMQQREGAENYDMDVSALAAGIYLMEIAEGNTVYSEKIIIQR